jgi:hypothetical protein
MFVVFVLVALAIGAHFGTLNAGVTEGFQENRFYDQLSFNVMLQAKGFAVGREFVLSDPQVVEHIQTFRHSSCDKENPSTFPRW